MGILMLMLWLVCRPGPDETFLQAVRTLSGVTDLEELDETEMERYTVLAAHPLPVNRTPRSRFLASGILSPYQVASLLDYRERNGDILSFAELARVDGFDEETACALRPFFSLEPSLPPGGIPEKTKSRQEMTVRTAFVRKGDPEADGQGWQYGLKYRYVRGDRWQVSFAGRNSYGERFFPPSEHTFSAVRYGERWLGKVVLGHFNARFGQGLSEWTGFRLSSLSSVSAFSLKPNLITPAFSYSGAGCYRGAAADFRLGKTVLSAYATLPENESFRVGANLSRFGRYGQAGTTATAEWNQGQLKEATVSLDGRYHFRGVDLFGETAVRLLQKAAAVRAGSRFRIGEGVEAAFLARALPTGYTGKKNGEYALSAGLDLSSGPYVTRSGQTGFGASVQRHKVSLTLDAAALPKPLSEPGLKQLKILASWQFQASPNWSWTLRLSERLGNGTDGNRTDIRLDAQREDGPWMLRFRANGVIAASFGALAYAEGGYRTEDGWVYVRATLFRADDWKDRIYCYERDAPGNFNVPARYGRGVSLSAVGALKTRKAGRWYLRLAWTGYAKATEKPGKAELKLQWMKNL